MLRAFLFVLAIAAVVMFVSVPALADDTKKANTHEGTVVSVKDNKIVMKGKADDTEHSHTLAPDATVWCDGKECKLDDLKPGQKVRVTTKKNDRDIATKIEALDKNQDFEPNPDK
jgi:hypothetical protein